MNFSNIKMRSQRRKDYLLRAVELAIEKLNIYIYIYILFIQYKIYESLTFSDRDFGGVAVSDVKTKGPDIPEKRLNASESMES